MGERTVTESRTITHTLEDYVRARQMEWFRAFSEATFDALILSEERILSEANQRTADIVDYEDAADLTGMGLAICRHIVERHQGLITAPSEPGVGAPFIVALPLYQMHDQQETSII